MRFTKKMVEVVERELRTRLTAEEVADGRATREVERFGNVKVVTVARSNHGGLNVQARYYDDEYKFANAWFDKPDAKFANRLRML